MLAIRLSPVGKKNKKMFRIVISEKARDPFGRALEILGSYNPHSKELVVKADRIKHWISQGAQMSPTVNNLLLDNKVIEGEKVKASQAGTKKKATPEPKAEKKEESPKEEAPAEEKPAEEPKEEVAEEAAPAEVAEEKPAEEESKE